MNYVTKATVLGARKLLDASLSGETVPLAKVKFGDGLGEEYEPTGEETHLKHVVCTVIPTIPSDLMGPQIGIKATIPADEGGFTVREVGVFDTDDEMIFIGNLPSTPKVVGQNGYIDDIAININVDAGHTNVITFQINPAFALASQAYVDERLEHDHDAQYLLKSETAKNSEKLNNQSIADIMQGTITNPIYLAEINIKSPPLNAGVYYQTSSAAATLERGYPITRAGSLEVTRSSSRGVVYTYKEYDSGETYVCGLYNDVWTDWQRLFDTSKPPTASQVGAVSLSGTAANASKLDNKTSAQLVAEARAGLLTTSGTAANASRLENKTKAQVVAEAKAGLIPSTSGGHAFSGRLISNNRNEGLFGVYDSSKIDHIWSMGESYKIASDGSDFGNLYGLAYKHTSNPTGGTMASGHQVVWCENGEPRSAIGTHLWTKAEVFEKEQPLKIRYLGISGKAANSAKLNGKGSTVAATPSTIVERSSYGNSVFNSVYAENFFENSTTLSNRYLGINARAKDAEKISGYTASKGATADTAVLRTASGNVVANNFYEGSFSLTSKYLGKTAKAVNSDKLDGYDQSTSWAGNTIVRRDASGSASINTVTCNNIVLHKSQTSPSGSSIESGYFVWFPNGAKTAQRVSVARLMTQMLTHVSSSSGGTGGTNPPPIDYCFALGTQVLLENDESVAIEMLRVGDKLKAIYHPTLATGNDTEWKTVRSDDIQDVEVKSAVVSRLILGTDKAYYVLNSHIKVTYEHPFLVYSKAFNDWRWIAISNIKVGDEIYSIDGNKILVESIDYVDEGLSTVSIDVEELDNYFVQLNGQWVCAHNVDENKV